MNTAHLHLMFTHLPIVGLCVTILISIYTMYIKSKDLMKLTIWLYVMLGVFALMAFFTGDGAEEIIKSYPGIIPDAIEDHENSALFFLIGILILSATALIGLYLSKTKEYLLKKFNIYLLIGALVLSLLALKTGYSGGEIRHTEMEKGALLNK